VSTGTRAVLEISVWQPAASLIAIGVEDLLACGRPAPKGWVGQRITIRSAFVVPRAGHSVGRWYVDRGHMPDGRTYDGYAMVIPYPRSQVVPLPLNAVVATATLVECLPITTAGWPTAHRVGRCLWLTSRGAMGGKTDGLWLITSDGTRGEVESYHEDQLPYSDFADGRWAWRFADVEPSEE
jgi:hypothetical protein